MYRPAWHRGLRICEHGNSPDNVLFFISILAAHSIMQLNATGESSACEDGGSLSVGVEREISNPSSLICHKTMRRCETLYYFNTVPGIINQVLGRNLCL
jgi:hypothetical protein